MAEGGAGRQPLAEMRVCAESLEGWSVGKCGADERGEAME